MKIEGANMKMILVTLLLLAKYCFSEEGTDSDIVIQDNTTSELKHQNIPHLFIFKRSANDSRNLSSNKKNADFVLVNTAIRGSDQKLKYSPVVDEKSISTTPSSAPVRRDERSAAHPTVSPHYSSTISYQFTTTDGLGYVHV